MASYSVITLLQDGTPVPVGVALWSSADAFYGIRVKFHPGLTTSQQSIVQFVADKINHWAKTKLPYQVDALAPSEDAWWEHVQKLLIHDVRLSEPRPVDWTDVLDKVFEDAMSKD